MKIVTSQEMGRIEQAAFDELGPEQAEIYMDRVGTAIGEKIITYLANTDRMHWPIILLAGKGNNGGDAFACGSFLLQKGLAVRFVQADASETLSPLCSKKCARFIELGGTSIDLSDLPKQGLLIDGLLGIGIKGASRAPYLNVIQKANQSGLEIFAIDLPSGMSGDLGPAFDDPNIIRAKRTFCLGLPKAGMVENSAFDYIGELELLDFGLPKKNVGTAKKQYDLLTGKWVQKHLPRLRPTRHKYESGMVGGFAGSEGLLGAAILSCTAVLRSGAGLVKWFHPEDLKIEGVLRPPEIMTKKLSYKNFNTSISQLLEEISRYKALFFGPGLSQSPDVETFLHNLMPRVPTKVVLDADALNVYANNPFELPENVVMTPHRLEMTRMLHRTKTISSNREDLEKCQAFATQRNVTLVLKGSPTFIFSPSKKVPAVCTQGDPGMATAGSGDVLTGIIAAFLAQGLDCFEAACVGTYIHGLSGKLSAQANTSFSLIASDIITFLPSALKSILASNFSQSEQPLPKWIHF